MISSNKNNRKKEGRGKKNKTSQRGKKKKRRKREREKEKRGRGNASFFDSAKRVQNAKVVAALEPVIERKISLRTLSYNSPRGTRSSQLII